MDLLKSLFYPEEAIILMKYKFFTRRQLCSDKASPAMRRCYELLVKTSRSFPDLILDMSQKTRDTICLAHLAIRALDTIEDDMTIDDSVKKPLLRTLYQKLDDPNWSFHHSQDKDKYILEEFTVVTKAFKELDSKGQNFVKDTLKVMGEGMASHKVTEIGTFKELDEYSHWSSGAIMEELEKFYSRSGLEDKFDEELLKVADDFGIFFQKVDNIKDYLEDLTEGRQLWPTEVWSKHASKLGDFATMSIPNECQCINELSLDCLKMIPDCLKYVFRAKDYGHFRFIAIRLCLLTLSLEKCYNNPAVFSKKVKARKGEIIKMIHYATSQERVMAVISHLIRQIKRRIPEGDPCADETRAICDRILNLCVTKITYSTFSIFPFLYVTSASVMTCAAVVWLTRYANCIHPL